MQTETKPWITRLREVADSLDNISDEQLAQAQSNKLAASRYKADAIMRNWERGLGYDMETYGKWIGAINQIADAVEAVIGSPEDFANWQKENDVQDTPEVG